MPNVGVGFILALLVLLMTPLTEAQTNRTTSPHSTTTTLKLVPDLAQRVAKFKPVEMPFKGHGLSPRERQLVDKLVEACRYI